MSQNTTDGTTIRLSDETKELLEREKESDETFDDTVRRMVGEASGELLREDETRELIDERISEAEADIRGWARAEAKDMIRQYGSGSSY